MKNNKIKIFMAASVLSLGLTSCEDFLDRPTEDSYVASGYYKTDAECIAAVDYLYNSPWYDFQRGFFSFDVMAEAIPLLLYSGRTSTPICHISLASAEQPANPISSFPSYAPTPSTSNSFRSLHKAFDHLGRYSSSN